MKIEDNKLIADFMGIKAKRFEINAYSHGYNVFHDASLSKLTFGTLSAWGTEEQAMAELFKKAKYNTSWDWLMPVVSRIEQNLFAVEIKENHCLITGYRQYSYLRIMNKSALDTKLTSTFNTIVEFIKWYNSTKTP